MPRAITVKLVSGKDMEVLNKYEQEWFNDTRNAYGSQLKFTDETDKQDLDRVMIHELMIFRWSQWISANKDYDGDMVDEERLRRNIKEYSDQLNKIKESLGLNKKHRDAAAAEGNFAGWLQELRTRARAFGFHRETQLTKMISLGKELFSIVTTFERADAEERKKLGFETEAEIVAWIRNYMKPEFDKLDEYFKTHEQKYWIQEM